MMNLMGWSRGTFSPGAIICLLGRIGNFRFPWSKIATNRNIIISCPRTQKCISYKSIDIEHYNIYQHITLSPETLVMVLPGFTYSYLTYYSYYSYLTYNLTTCKAIFYKNHIYHLCKILDYIISNLNSTINDFRYL